MSAAPSYSSGESATPLLGDTIGGNFDATVRRFGDREALVDRPASRRWTYTELAADVDALALGLLEMGIEKATESVSGHRTARNGLSPSTRRPRSARSWSTSTPLTAPASLSSCSISQGPSCS
jgi:hypothetical protein